VDYISFKFQDLKDWKEKELASYLLKLGFNCYRESRKLRKSIKTPIFMGLKNIHEACFVVDNPYWQGTVVTFSGLSAKFFYMLLQEKKLRGEAFSDSILDRFDIYYRREDRKTDKTLPEYFLEICHKDVRKTNQNVSFEKNQKGLILKLGNRKANNYCRIYKEKTRKLNATILTASPRQFRFFAAPNENFAPNRNWHCNNSSYIWSWNKRSTDL